MGHGQSHQRGQRVQHRGQTVELSRQNVELAAKLKEILEIINYQSVDEHQHVYEEAAAALINLAGQIKAYRTDGRSFGFFGLTSTGKSTIINRLLGENVAEVGVGETTVRAQPYEGRNYTLYDIAGRNDDMSYFSMENISFWKGLTSRLVVITTTVKEMAKEMRLLDEIGLSYDIIVNKFDNIAMEERDLFKEKIRNEVEMLGLKSGKRIWFLSAKNPDKFSDWLDMVNYSTTITMYVERRQLLTNGRSFGFFGLTSTGKSTIINRLLGKNIAEVGLGETTIQAQQYEGRNYTLYDIPGRNDDMSYFSMENISFWKGLTSRIVVITTTLKEMAKVLSLLDAIGLSYDIVVNKLDTIPHTERETFKAKIKGEIVEFGLKSGKRIWFFSAKNTDQFPDWLDMVDTLTN